MATGDSLLCEGGLQGADRRGEDVGLLQHMRRVRSIQRAEHCAVIQLHSLEELQHRELVPSRFGVPVCILDRNDF